METAIDDLYTQRIKLLSDDQKRRLVELITRELASKNGGRYARDHMSQAERQSARERFRRHAGAVSLGSPIGADNEQIDVDLAREHGACPESH